MKKLSVPVLALLISGLSAGAAGANNGVAGARVNPDPGAVRAYWTPERMRNAIPRDIVRGGQPAQPFGKPGGSGGGTTAPGTAVLATWPTDLTDLTYTNGKVYFTDKGVGYVCSGTAINSQNGSVVWTAGHCVNEGGPNYFFDNWKFMPAYNSGRGFPDFIAGHLYTSSAWATSGDFGKDYGAAVVLKNGSQSLEDTLGGIGRDLNFATPTALGTPLDAWGYPAAGKFNGRSLYHCPSQIKYNDGSADPATNGIPCTMTGGSSGGAWLDSNGKQVSNNSYGYSSLKNVMFGPQFGSIAQELFATADGTTTQPDIVGNG
ncbi:MAG TPA: hypothetical protein VF066_04280 [Thermoleophilaceae bacterium]